ncbi:response regulator [Arhodomonas aquaeolei]|uniref:response regulator n=1 Tax=Arhodomonas aquaeolei TaxID=2369 RepID=UPI00036AAF46|nr:response regulator [Arhodomonas aquaeolei]
MPEPDIHLVDDDASTGDACRFLLEGYGYGVTYWSAGTDFLAGATLEAAGCVILDLRMPRMDGTAVHAALRERRSPLGVVILTAHGDVPTAVEQMKQGAADFLQKPVNGTRLIAAVDTALARSRSAWEVRILAQRATTLSERERHVARLVRDGLTNRAIAERLHVAVRTVEVHRAAAMRKMGAHSSAELAALWQRVAD